MLKAHHPKHHRRPRYLQTLLLLCIAAYLSAEQPTPLPPCDPAYEHMLFTQYEVTLNHALPATPALWYRRLPKKPQDPATAAYDEVCRARLAALGLWSRPDDGAIRMPPDAKASADSSLPKRGYS